MSQRAQGLALPADEKGMILSEIKHKDTVHETTVLYHYTGPPVYPGRNNSDMWDESLARPFAHHYRGHWYDPCGRRIYELPAILKFAAIALPVEVFTAEYVPGGQHRSYSPAINAHEDALQSLSALIAEVLT